MDGPNGPKWTVPRKWAVRPKVDGLEPNGLSFEPKLTVMDDSGRSFEPRWMVLGQCRRSFAWKRTVPGEKSGRSKKYQTGRPRNLKVDGPKV